jgi:peroxiredoxin
MGNQKENTMQDFELTDQAGQPWRLTDALQAGAVVLVFYRGDWCSYCNGQLATMAREYSEYLRRGATIAAVVIDPPEQNAAMVQRLALPFPILADPGGARVMTSAGVWDAAGKMATPAIVVVAPDGHEVYRYVGVDFMDRPGDEEVLAALDGLGLPPIDVPLEPVPHLPPVPGPRAVLLSDLGAYMRGVRFAMQAMAARARDAWDRAEAERTGKMAERYVAAQGATRRATADRVASGSGAAP